MFRIADTRDEIADTDGPGALVDQTTINLLAQFCVVDHWSANLANAMLRIGEQARVFHGLPGDRDRFGLLELVRCYDEKSHRPIIALFEHAAFESRPFHFSAELKQPANGHRVVHCFGAYRSMEGRHTGEELFGLFLFSRDLYADL